MANQGIRRISKENVYFNCLFIWLYGILRKWKKDWQLKFRYRTKIFKCDCLNHIIMVCYIKTVIINTVWYSLGIQDMQISSFHVYNLHIWCTLVALLNFKVVIYFTRCYLFLNLSNRCEVHSNTTWCEYFIIVN